MIDVSKDGWLIVQKRVWDFLELSHEDKVKKLLAVLAVLKDNDEVFPKIIDLLNIKKDVSDKFLDGVYQDIVELEVYTSEYNKQKALDKLEYIQIKLANMRVREEQERLEENPDGILDRLLG